MTALTLLPDDVKIYYANVKIFQTSLSEPVNINMSLVHVAIFHEVKAMPRVWKTSDKFYKPPGLKYEMN